jgi:hypothetical protein
MPNVPCNGCVACCIRPRVRIREHEDASRWQTVPHDQRPGRMLARKPDGSCIYLDGGCTIQDNKPEACSEADCREIAAQVSYTKARKLDRIGSMPIQVWKKGRELGLHA